jgi:hypothetical protein
LDTSILLTLFGLLVAVYAIIPPERKQDLKVRFNFIDWVLFTAAFLIIHYILFFPILIALGIPSLGYWAHGFNPDNTSYIVIIITSFILMLRYIYAPLRKNKIDLFQKLTERLLQEEKFSDLLFVFEKNLDRLFKIYKADFFLPRLKRRWSPNPLSLLDLSKFGFSNTISDQENVSKFQNLKNKIKNYTKGYLIKFLPDGERHARKAEIIIGRVLLSVEFNNYLSKANPPLCFKILKIDFRERRRFLKLLVNNLLLNKNSILFFEIINSEETAGMYRPKIDDRNQFLSFFLKDTSVAHTLAIYKPFGDFFLEFLDKLYVNRENDRYNEPLLNYFEEDKYECPLYITLRFFDLMVLESLYQNMKWHMWLFYLPSFVRKIIRNLNPSPSVDFSIEWPTPYHYLLYEILSILINFVRAIHEIPKDQENIQLDNERVDHENDNIPKSAILAIGQTMRMVVLSDKIDLNFKSYLLSTVLGLLNDLRTPDTDQYRRVLQKSVLSGGYSVGYDNTEYLAKLNETKKGVDDILLHGELDEND